MPTFNETDDDKVIEKEQKTLPGLQVVTGEITTDYDSKDWQDLQKDYTEMRNGDCIASTSLEMLKAPLSASTRNIIPGKDTPNGLEMVRYADWVYDSLADGFDNLKRHKLLAIDYGVIMHEIITKRGVMYIDSTGKKKITNTIIKLSPFLNETINDFLVSQETGEFSGIEHERRIPNGITEFITIEADRLDVFSYRKEFNDVRGRGVLRPARSVWDQKTKNLSAKTIATQRGAGLVVLEFQGQISAQDKLVAQKIGRTMGLATPDQYVAYDKTKMEAKLLEPKNQADVMELLSYLDRQMFFNTQTQFATSGLGENGSRAAAGELKTSYELAIEADKRALEQNFQALTNRIMEMSYLAKTPKEEWPIFTLTGATDIDLDSLAANMKIYYDTNIMSKQPGDEAHFRQLYGVPQSDVVEVSTDSEETDISTAMSKKLAMNMTAHRELTALERDVFELESTKNSYIETQQDVSNVLDNIINRYVNNIVEQAKTDKDQSFQIRFENELVKKIMKIYDREFNKGQSDAKKELGKIGIKTDSTSLSIKLALTPKQVASKNKAVKRWSEKLLHNIKSTSEDMLQKLDMESINKKGGVGIFLAPLKSGFKTDRRKVSREAEAGIVDGRGQVLKSQDPELVEFFYSAILDGNLCEVCAPYDGLTFTLEELRQNDLHFSKPVNHACLGKDDCRCVLIPDSKTIVGGSNA